MDRDLMIAAYVDGELSGAEAAAVEAQLRHDPVLARDVEQTAAIRARLAAAYDPILHQSIPPQLTALASAANDSGRARALWRAGGLAAALAVGVLVGRAAWPDGGSLVTHQGVLVARGDLARALDTQLASDTGEIQVGLTFKDGGQTWCRTFASAGRPGSGVACRRDDRWVIEALAPRPATVGADSYRTASSALPPALLAAVEQLRSGDAMDAQQEESARDAGWPAPQDR